MTTVSSSCSVNWTGAHRRSTTTRQPAGSARAELRSAATTSVFQSDTNGYQDQWTGLYDALVRDVDPVVPLSVTIDDILYALDLVAQLDDHFREAR